LCRLFKVPSHVKVFATLRISLTFAGNSNEFPSSLLSA
jgi:hypothetical protein